MARFLFGFAAGALCALAAARAAVKGWLDDAGRAQRQQGMPQPPWPAAHRHERTDGPCT